MNTPNDIIHVLDKETKEIKRALPLKNLGEPQMFATLEGEQYLITADDSNVEFLTVQPEIQTLTHQQAEPLMELVDKAWGSEDNDSLERTHLHQSLRRFLDEPNTTDGHLLYKYAEFLTKNDKDVFPTTIFRNALVPMCPELAEYLEADDYLQFKQQKGDM